MQATSAASGFASHAPAGSGPIPDVPAHARAFARIPDLPPGLSPGAVALAVAVGIESVTASTSEAGWWVLHDLDRWAETLNPDGWCDFCTPLPTPLDAALDRLGRLRGRLFVV